MTDAFLHLPYRPCVGIMLINAQGLVFTAQRIDQQVEAWQMPQGGIDVGEDPLEAAMRELEEEIGTNRASLLAEHPEWLSYDLPGHLLGKVWKGKYRGQTMKWFAMRFDGTDNDIKLETEVPEFNTWRWQDMAALPDMIVPFKRDLYTRLASDFAHLVQS
jgi:putative (di)nucleoside polyphosphate hydrolase